MIANEQTDLLELIQNASEMSEGLIRMDAVRRLKKRSLQRLDALALSEFARKAEDPAWRTTAAQVLGYHAVAVHYPDLVEPLTGAATTEKDPEARRALVYAVRGTEGMARLIDHPLADVAREATSGIRESESDWHLVLDAYFGGLSPDIETRVLRLIGQPDEAACWVVSYLLQSAFQNAAGNPSERAAILFQVIDQGLAFATLIEAQDTLERTHLRIWPGLARRERKRVLLELFTQSVREVGLQPSLAEILVDRVLGSTGFLTTHGRTLRAVFRGLSSRDGDQLMIVMAHAFDQGNPKGKQGLADLMMMVGKEISGTVDTVGMILAEWKDAPPEMLVKIRQTRMGIR